jgi:hypothetical protein
MVFLSYSRKDRDAAKALYDRLRTGGYKVWFDEESLLPGEDWELEIHKAIKNCSAVIICLSSNWVNDRGYVQKELKMTLEVFSEMPEGKVFVIPVKLDTCELPPSLSRLHWISFSETDGFERLRKAIDTTMGVPTIASVKAASQSVTPWQEIVEDIIAKGGMIYLDDWTTGNSQEELAFKVFLKDRWNTGMDLFEAQNWEGVINLWKPLLSNPFFRIEHPEWADKPYFRCQIHSAKSQLFFAHVQLGQSAEYKTHVPIAYSLLNEVLLANPYSQKGESHDRLPTDHAETQNLNYRDTLNFALQWYEGWDGCFDVVGIENEEAKKTKTEIFNRLSEIEFMSKLRPK